MINVLKLCILFIGFKLASAEIADDLNYVKQNHLKKIGIIGGGIGGTATAYFLRKLLGEEILVHLYEPGTIGGRLATSSTFDEQYETGGSILHPKNHYMNEFVNELGLKKNFGCESKFGIFDGKDFDFLEANWSFINIINGLMRYGFDVYWLRKINEEMLNNFSRIYDHQKMGISFKSVGDLLSSMDPAFPSLAKKSIRVFLKEKKLHDLIINELVSACTRANFGQSPSIHAFVGSVSLAAANADLWAVEGGNKKVPEELLKYSQAIRIEKQVTKLSQLDNEKFRVWSKLESSDGIPEEEFTDYDAVVIATPLTKDKSKIDFVNFKTPFEFPGSYERIVCTLVLGKLNETTFKYKETGARIEEILTDNPSLFYNSVGRQFSVREGDRCTNSDSQVYKVFSPELLTEQQLSHLFQETSGTEVIDWLAYPHYSSKEELGFFELVPGLYYNNAIEWAASAMEMSSVAAKNSALLVQSYLSEIKGAVQEKGKSKMEL